MEEEKDKKEKELEKMFDSAQFLAENFPDIAELFTKAESNAEMFQAFKSGKEAYEIEQRNKENDRLPKWMQKDRLTKAFNENDKNKDVDKDKEPDK